MYGLCRMHYVQTRGPRCCSALTHSHRKASGHSRLDIIADQFGFFTSPLRLPDWLNGMLAVATVVAGVERALSLRSHRLADTALDLEGDE